MGSRDREQDQELARALSPSPNWYCSRCSDTSPGGVLGFGAKNSIFLLGLSPSQPLALGELVGHTERVTGFTFCHHPGLPDTCASSSDDGTVKVWDTQTRTVLKEHTAHQSTITALHWSPLRKELVVSADEKGIVICWWYTKNDTHHFFPEPRNIFCLTCSPHNEEHVALGYKDGMIVIIDINRKGEVVHRLRGHDGEIHFLSWCPQLCEEGLLCRYENTSDGLNGELVKSDTARGSFLASGSKDQTIRVWNTTKGKGVLTLKLPSLKRRGGADVGTKERIWLTVHWPRGRPTQLVSSSFGGELLLWDLTKSGKQRWTLLGPSSEGQNHSRIVFNLSSVCLQDNRQLLLSTSMDRDVKCWDLTTLDCCWTQPTLGGFVYSLAFSPINVGSLAIGVGDGMIRVWDTLSLQSAYDIKTLWQGIKSKVTSLCWHPTKESSLAFGTDDGKVGIYEIYSNKPPQISSSYHRKTVYALAWGPPLPPLATGRDGDGPAASLYSCAGEGTILQHNPWKLSADAQDINCLIRETNGIKHKLPGHSELNWKPDGKVLAIGNDDGSIEIFQAPRLKLLCTIQTHHKLLNAIRWHHPHGTRPDLGYLLASGSNNAIIHIHNLKAVLENPPDSPVMLTEPYRTLPGHTAKITSLSWSPHRDAMLVSACYDGTAQVWDVLKEEPLCNYRGHIGRLLGVQWSPVDADSVWTGGDDFTVQQWEVSKQEHTRPPKGKKAFELDKRRVSLPKPKSKKARRKNEKGPTGQEGDECPETPSQCVPTAHNGGGGDPEEEEECREPVEMAKMSNGISRMPASLAELRLQERTDPLVHNFPPTATNQTPQLKKERPKEERRRERPEAPVKKKKGRSVLPLSTANDHRSKEELHSDCVNLAHILYSKESPGQSRPGSGEEIQLGLFVDRPALYRMFEEEGRNHLEAGHPEMCYQLLLWRGDVRGALEMASERGELNDTLVAMAPMAGYVVWMKTIEAFVKQLCFQEQYIKAATYLLSIHRVYEAVQLLRSHQLFREAIAIAKARLQPEDPVLKELFTCCAGVMEKDGHYTIAAKCYLTAESPYDAAKILARKGDVASLRTAAEVAAIVGERELSVSFSSRCAHDLLALRDWLGAQEVLQTQGSLLGQRLVLCTYELLYRSLADRDLTLWKSISAPCYHSWALRSGEPLINAVTAVWQSEFGIMAADMGRLKTAHSQLRMTEYPTASLNTPPRLLLLHLSQELSLAITSMLLSAWAEMVTFLLKALVRCLDSGNFTLMQEISKIVLPEAADFVSDLEVQLTSADPLGLAALRSLRAYLCYGQVYELWWELAADRSGRSPAAVERAGTEERPEASRADEEENPEAGGPRPGQSVNLSGQADTTRPPLTAAARELLARCGCLLSPEHAQFQALARRTAGVQRAVAELVSQHQRGSSGGPGPETELGADSKMGPEMELGAGPEPETELGADSRLVPEMELGADSKLGSEMELGADSKLATGPEMELSQRPETGTRPEAEMGEGPKMEQETNSKLGTGPEAELVMGPEKELGMGPETEQETGSKLGPETELGTGPETEQETDSKLGTGPDKEPAENSITDHRSLELSLSGEETSCMATLMEQLRDITQQQSQLDESVKLHPFPDVVEASLVLLSIASLAPSVLPRELRDKALALARTHGTAAEYRRAVGKFLREAV
uniref:gem-associated protein 5 isoform X2 n=1 Tax=Pristiophorus japonicus TaxID=55135 RepID=UPI00398EDF24